MTGGTQGRKQKTPQDSNAFPDCTTQVLPAPAPAIFQLLSWGNITVKRSFFPLEIRTQPNERGLPLSCRITLWDKCKEFWHLSQVKRVSRLLLPAWSMLDFQHFTSEIHTAHSVEIFIESHTGRDLWDHLVPPSQAASSPVQPGLGYFQEWGSFSGQLLKEHYLFFQSLMSPT